MLTNKHKCYEGSKNNKTVCPPPVLTGKIISDSSDNKVIKKPNQSKKMRQAFLIKHSRKTTYVTNNS